MAFLGGSHMQPLAVTLRPQNLDEFVGQQHLVGSGKPLAIAVQKKHIFSFLLWGPPGVGKTTLARIYAQAINADYHELSAVSASKDDIRKIIVASKNNLTIDQPDLRSLGEVGRSKVLFL